ncbi:hypothetical protein CBL_13418 [Carabus blaptoides fortunei]
MAKQRSPCICVYDDDRKVDLSSLSDGDFISAYNANYTYYFHACTNKKLVLPSIDNKTKPCDSTSLCLLNRVNNSTISLGKIDDAKFSNTKSGTADELDIIYSSKEVTSIITLACTQMPESYLKFKQSDANQHFLILFSPLACSHYEYHGLSTGSVLVILLFVFAIIYLFGGATVLHFLRGARGKEMIPNIEFWTDLPLLVKDGAVFLQNGCKPVMSNSESYDRI